MDSEATEGNTENEQEDVCQITGETIWFSSQHYRIKSFWNLEFYTCFCSPASQLYLSSFLLPGCKRGPWSLVCETEEQWVSLAESIKDKTSPQDRHLYRIISQNFLPEIRSMIEHKVRPLGGTCNCITASNPAYLYLSAVCQPLPKKFKNAKFFLTSFGVILTYKLL